MVNHRSPLAILGASFLFLGGCSFSSDALWPSLSGEEAPQAKPGQHQSTTYEIKPPSGQDTSQPTITSSAAGGKSSPPQLGTTNFQVQAPQPGQPTGTFVGNKVVQLRDDLSRLQTSISQHNRDLQAARQQTIGNAGAYHSRVAAIEARLQVGTTPGNPRLVSDWNQAQQQLETVNADIGSMNNLSNRVSADAAMSAYLLEATRAAFGLSGAVDEDHRQLEVLEDDVNKTVVLIQRLLTELSTDIARQSTYVANERADLNTLALAIKNGEMFGRSLSSRAMLAGGSYVATSPGNPAVTSVARGSAASGRRPLVVIRFDRPNVQYQQALYTAVSRALERRPNASFDLVAVSPLQGSSAQAALNSSTARKNAQTVLRSLTDMGLPTDRVMLSAQSAPDASSNEVRIFVR